MSNSRKHPPRVAWRRPAVHVLIWAVVWLSAAAVNIPAARPLDLRVRAHGQLRASVTAAGTLVRVGGSLRDELDQELPQRQVRVAWIDESDGAADAPPAVDELYTDRRGSFRTHRELAPGPWRVVVGFSGTDHVTATKIVKTVDVTPAPVDLRVQAPSLVLGSPGDIPVRVRAKAAGVGLSETAIVSVNGQQVDRIALDQFGRGRADISAVVRDGRNHVNVVIAAGKWRDSVHATQECRVVRQLQADARFHEVVRRFERGLAVDGTVRDALGPVAGAHVTVSIARQGAPGAEADGSTNDIAPNGAALDGAFSTGGSSAGISSAGGSSKGRLSDPADAETANLERFVSTDESGHFRAFYRRDDLQEGVWDARVRMVPEAGDEHPIATESVELDGSMSRWILNILGVLALMATIGLVIYRLGAVIGAWRARRARRRDTDERAEEAAAAVDKLEPVALGADQASIGAAQTDQRSLSGLVWDVWQSRPVGAAQVRVMGAGAEAAATCRSAGPADARPGVFVIDGLDDGHYELHIRAPGYMPAQLAFELPHGGRLHDVRFDLVAVPLKIRRLYQSLVESLEGRDLWGKLSPRQIEQTLRHVADEADVEAQSGRHAFIEGLRDRLDRGGEQSAGDGLTGDELVALMTGVVEQTYFSGQPVDMDVFELARQLAQRLRSLAEEGQL